MRQFDVIVIGGGHAGTEAALASARMGCSTLLLTLNIDTLGHISCNPSVGGIGKGHLTREIDALGGEMAKAADFAAIQYRRLNTSKGPSTRGLRVQVDRALYMAYIKKTLLGQPNLHVRQGLASQILTEKGSVRGIKTVTGEFFAGKTAVLTPGTFLRGLIHIGLTHFPGGRLGDLASEELDENLRELGFSMGRFKTGTPPRIDGRTVDFSVMTRQESDENPEPFSFASGARILNPQRCCYITKTNERTHEIIRQGREHSPLFTGVITGTGVRYCPSIEDKITKFADRTSHHIFMEPEGLDSTEYYPNGLSTSLPAEIQIEMVRSIPGMEEAEILRPGYGIEHSYCDPRQLYPTLETKKVKNLFFAGQINATTGYEEAAAQGIAAGINAALKVQERAPLILDRAQAYIGVLIDDLTTKGTEEPYRMFSSRCEYRLMLREDNADLRLRETGWKLGLVNDGEYERTKTKKENIERETERLHGIKITPKKEVNEKLESWSSAPIKKTMTLAELLRRNELNYGRIAQFLEETPPLTAEEIFQVELNIKYELFFERQELDVEKFKNLENMKIPENFVYRGIPGLSLEVVQKLEQARPLSLGQASRISGITPAAIWTLMIYLKQY